MKTLKKRIANKQLKKCRTKDLDDLILKHLMSKYDVNSLAIALVDEKIAELVPLLEVGDCIDMSCGSINGVFYGFDITPPDFHRAIKISTEEIAKIFDIVDDVRDTSSPKWHAVITAINNAYDSLPKRSRYFEYTVCGGVLRFVSK